MIENSHLLNGLQISLCSLIASMMLSACSSDRIDKLGVGRLVSHDCAPVSGQKLRVANVTRGAFLGVAFTDVLDEKLVTDDSGYFEFGIGRGDELVIVKVEGEEDAPLRQLQRQLYSGGYKSLNELNLAAESTRENPLLVYKDVSKIGSYWDGSPFLFISSGYFREQFTHMHIGLGAGQLRFGRRDGRNVIVVTPDYGKSVAEITTTDDGEYRVGEASDEIVIEGLFGDDLRFFLVKPDDDKRQTSIISLRIFYKPETGKIYLHSYLQKVIADKQEVPGTLSISLESCGGHMDRGMAGWYTIPRVLKQQQALAQLKEPVEPDVESMLEATGYIDSDAAMGGLRKNTALTQDLLALMLKYDFFEDRYARDIAHLAQQRGWTDVVNALTNDPRSSSGVHQTAARFATPGSGDTGEVPARDARRNAIGRDDRKLGVYGGYKLDSGYVPTEHLEYMYCMHPGMAKESLAQNPYTPDEVLFDIFKNSSHLRDVITKLAVNPTTPQEVIEKIFLRDYPADLGYLRPVLPEVSSCDHRLTSSVRKYALFQAQSSCADNQDEDVRDLIQGARKKDSITLDCAAYRERTLARLHPEVEIRGYGKIDYKPHFADDEALGGEYSIAEPSGQLNAEDGMLFGVIYLLGGDEYYRLIGNETQIDQIVIGPDGEAVTEAVFSSSSLPLGVQDSELFYLHNYYGFYKQIDDADAITKGRWVFRLQHKGDVLAEQTITLK